MQIISVSRRTDVPTFYGDWFMGRVRAGWVRYPNPFGGQVYEVSLKPEDVAAFVFWSKYYGPFTGALRELDSMGYRFYCHYTITGLPRIFERRVADTKKAIAVFHKIAEVYGPERIIWRYDPIVMSDTYDTDEHLRTFERLARQLAGSTQQCYFSFMTWYGKVKRQFSQLRRVEGIRCKNPTLPERRRLAEELSNIAGGYGITCYSCCEDALVDGSIRKGRCVSGKLVSALFPEVGKSWKAAPTRDECGCTKSIDIGVYDTCPAGCLYCYATRSQHVASERRREHDSAAPMLWQRRANGKDAEAKGNAEGVAVAT